MGRVLRFLSAVFAAISVAFLLLAMWWESLSWED